mmetsp:Transcript_10693/g.24562  ORF Transcript_10693/g.24562 Transcript_10693/m.24562 type:complete len:281 (-) Transcript_10693:1168-2010(-)
MVARRRHGLEVLHLYTGRILTRLPLTESHGAVEQAHGDINGDSKVDHVVSLSSEATEGLERPHRFGVSTAACVAIARSGVPMHDVLWNASTCGPNTRIRLPKHTTTAPLLVPRSGVHDVSSKMDSVILMSSGLVTSIGPDGKINWVLSTEASWQIDVAVAPTRGMPSMMPSLSLLHLGDAEEPKILAVGERVACLISVRGHGTPCTRLPSAAIAPPTLGDFDGDGVADVIITGRTSYYGLRACRTAGSMLKQLVFGFAALAALAVVGLNYGRMLPKIAVD